MSLTGNVQNGIVVFDTPNVFPDGTLVRVEAIETAIQPVKRSLLERLGDVVGKVEGLPADASQTSSIICMDIPRNEGPVRDTSFLRRDFQPAPQAPRRERIFS